MLPDIQPGNTKILYFFNCLLDGMHTKPGNTKILYFFNCLLDGMHTIFFLEASPLPAANQIFSLFVVKTTVFSSHLYYNNT